MSMSLPTLVFLTLLSVSFSSDSFSISDTLIEYSVFNQTSITFTVTSPGSGWLGFGVSSSGMVGGDVFIALPNENTVKRYLITSRNAGGFVEIPHAQGEFSQSDAGTTMTFTRDLSTSEGTDILLGSNRFILAYGSSNSLGYHAFRAVSEVDISSGEVAPPTSLTSSMYVLHGLIMLLAWGILVHVGISMSLFYRHKAGGFWFTWHQKIQSLVVILTFLGVLIAMIETSNMETAHFSSTHPKIGLSILVLLGVQVLSGAFRPHCPGNGCEKSTQRWLFEKGHRVLATVIIVLAVVNMSSGVGFAHVEGAQSALTAIFVMTIIGAAGWYTAKFLQMRYAPRDKM